MASRVFKGDDSVSLFLGKVSKIIHRDYPGKQVEINAWFTPG
jgi:hypothetical protein